VSRDFSVTATLFVVLQVCSCSQETEEEQRLREEQIALEREEAERRAREEEEERERQEEEDRQRREAEEQRRLEEEERLRKEDPKHWPAIMFVFQVVREFYKNELQHIRA